MLGNTVGVESTIHEIWRFFKWPCSGTNKISVMRSINLICRVDVHHDNRGISGHVSWAQNFTVTLGQNVIHLLQNHVVEVSDCHVKLLNLYHIHKCTWLCMKRLLPLSMLVYYVTNVQRDLTTRTDSNRLFKHFTLI